jgi:hypothetical protein
MIVRCITVPRMIVVVPTFAETTGDKKAASDTED